MLTQGWRRYVWSEMNLKRYGEENQSAINGDIKGQLYYPKRKRKIPKEQTFVMAFSPNKDSVKLLIAASPEGLFTVPEEMLKEWENDYVYMKPYSNYRTKLNIKTSDPLARSRS